MTNCKTTHLESSRQTEVYILIEQRIFQHQSLALDLDYFFSCSDPNVIPSTYLLPRVLNNMPVDIRGTKDEESIQGWNN